MEQLFTTQPSECNKWWIALGVSIGVFIFAIDVYVINLALPVMVESLQTGFAVIQWVVLSYLIAIAVSVLSIARLGDIWDKRVLYLVGLGVFTLASLACGFSVNVVYLIVFRALQGLGAAFLSGLGTAILVETFPTHQRGLILGIRAGVYGLGITLGPSLGGVLLPLGGWPLIFWINVPIGLLGMIIIILFMPSSSVTHSQRGVDVQGTLSLMVTLSCFMAAITLAQMNVLELPFILVLMGLTVVGLVAFLWIESTQTDPMLDLTLFQSVPLSAGLALRLMGNLCIAAIIFILPFFLELVQHYPPDRAGLLLAIPPIIISIFAPLSGLTSDWIGGRTVSLVGLGLICLSCVFLGSMDESSSLTFYGIAVVPYALGVALFQSPNNNTIMGAVSRQHLGIAAGLLSLARILGQSIGIPLSGLIFSRMVLSGLDGELSVLDAPVSALVMGSRMAFWSMAALLSGGTLVIAGLWFWFGSKLPSRSDG